jgi:cytochrome c
MRARLRGSFRVSAGLLLLGTALAATGQQTAPTPPPQAFGIGRLATPEEIAARDIDIGPDGAGLPPGRGTPAEGAVIYAARCASCHGTSGTEGPNDVLVGRIDGGGFPFSRDPKAPRTIGTYWPYATTLFDYIRRAMPTTAPGSLTDDEVYALVAQLLAWNGLVAADAVIDAQSLPTVRMPARDRFVPDNRGGQRTPPPR